MYATALHIKGTVTAVLYLVTFTYIHVDTGEGIMVAGEGVRIAGEGVRMAGEEVR